MTEHELRCLRHSMDFRCSRNLLSIQKTSFYRQISDLGDHLCHVTSCKDSGTSCMTGIGSPTKDKLAEKAYVAKFGTFVNFPSKKGNFVVKVRPSKKLTIILRSLFHGFLA